MFIQMSSEQFQKEYASKKLIMIQKDESEENPASKKQSPREDRKEVAVIKRGNGKDAEKLDLGGLVKIKAYESTMTDELPAV